MRWHDTKIGVAESLQEPARVTNLANKLLLGCSAKDWEFHCYSLIYLIDMMGIPYYYDELWWYIILLWYYNHTILIWWYFDIMICYDIVLILFGYWLDILPMVNSVLTRSWFQRGASTVSSLQTILRGDHQKVQQAPRPLIDLFKMVKFHR